MGDWKQLYGEMALREKGIDTIRIVMESGPILVRTRNRTSYCDPFSLFRYVIFVTERARLFAPFLWLSEV